MATLTAEPPAGAGDPKPPAKTESESNAGEAAGSMNPAPATSW